MIGIDNYKASPLGCCCNDTKEMGLLLSKHGDGFPNFNVKTQNNIGTRGELRRLIEELFRGDDDIALFYYSGHGYIDSLGGYLVTPDYADHDWGVSLQELLTIANESHCRDRIIILDSCFSGAMGSISSIGQNITVIKEGVTILTASRDAEAAVETNGHGVFTSLLLEALNGGAADVLGHITVGSIYAFIDKALGSFEQRPCFKTNVVRFTSLRNVAPRVNISVIRETLGYFASSDSEFPLDPTFEFTEKTANPENVAKFKNLQKLVGIGLVAPVGEEHMYFAALNRKSCKLTAVGKHYWKVAQEGRI